jgi:hypothetical protein
MKLRFLLIVFLTAGLAAPASAGIIFGKKPKVPPEKRVPELLAIVRTDGDENKRLSAAEELRQFDPMSFPQIVPTLIEVLMSDKKASVRSEAAQTLSKLRPVSSDVGVALEYARDHDASLRVRMQARQSLLSYHWAGWSNDPGKLKPDGPPKPSTKEPPLAPTTPPPAAPPAPVAPPPAPPQSPFAPVTISKPIPRPTPEPAAVPPLAPVIATPPPPTVVIPPSGVQPPPGAQPLPKGPTTPPPAAPPTKEEKGPELGPQE